MSLTGERSFWVTRSAQTAEMVWGTDPFGNVHGAQAQHNERCITGWQFSAILTAAAQLDLGKFSPTASIEGRNPICVTRHMKASFSLTTSAALRSQYLSSPQDLSSLAYAMQWRLQR